MLTQRGELQVLLLRSTAHRRRLASNARAAAKALRDQKRPSRGSLNASERGIVDDAQSWEFVECVE
jgi:hypothetical protein